MHVLGTPPAFILSQDQTLLLMVCPVKINSGCLIFPVLLGFVLNSSRTQGRIPSPLFFEFSGSVYCSIFNSQGSVAFGLKTERRRRDLNPRAATNDLLPFQGSPFNHLGTSAWLKNSNYQIITRTIFLIQRREWDSNPRALADKRFSRPPRYDHFDISPNVLVYYIKLFSVCQELFKTFFRSFSEWLL